MSREHMSPERLAVCSKWVRAEQQRGPDMSGVSPISELLAEVALLRDERDAFTGRHMIYDIYDGSEIECLCGKHFGRLNFTDSMRDYREHVLASVAGQQEVT